MDIFEAAAAGDLPTIQRLLAEGADPSAPDASYSDEEAQKLRRAAYQVGEEFAFLQHKFGRTALHHAADEGHADVVAHLLAAGAAVDARDVLGRTPLALALVGKKPAIVRALLDAGAAVDVIDGLGEPLLTVAFTEGRLEIARELLQRGAPAKPAKVKRDQQPLSALLEAFPTTFGDHEINFFGDDDEEEEEFDVEQGVALVREMLARGADPKHREYSTQAVMTNLPELLEMFVEAGADLHVMTDMDETLLDWAIGCEADRVVEYLRKAGVEQSPERDDDEEMREWEAEQEARAARLIAAPVAERRGLVGADGNSWDLLLARAPAEMVVAAFHAGGKVESSRKVEIDEHLDAPLSDVLQIVRLHGHSWSFVLSTKRLEGVLAQVLSDHVQDRALWLGYNDTANATWYQLYQCGELAEGFETTGGGFAGDEDWDEDDEDWDDEEDWDDDDEWGGEDLENSFKSTLRDPESVDFKQYEDEDAFVEEFLRSHDAYAPVAGLGTHGNRDGTGNKLELWCHPEDVLTPENIAESWFVIMKPYGIQTRWSVPSEATKQLFSAVRERDADAVSAALVNGPDLQAVPPNRSQTPLGVAGTDAQIAGLLVVAGADPNDAGEEPALHALADKAGFRVADALETMQVLLVAGADVHRLDKAGRGVLHHATKLSVIKFLLLAGADPNVRDAAGHTARESSEAVLKLSGAEELEEIVDLLRRAEEGAAEITETREELIDQERQREAEEPNPFEQFGKMMESLAGMSGDAVPDVPGATTQTPFGPLELTPTPDPAPLDPRVEADVAAFEARGYVRSGAYVFPEMPGLRMVGLADEAERIYASVYQHPSVNRPITDVMQNLVDGTEITVGNAPQGGEVDTRPGTSKHFIDQPVLDIDVLLTRVRETAAGREAKPTPVDGFAEDLQHAYRADMEWRMGHGMTKDEIRRVAEASDMSVTESEIALAQAALRPRSEQEQAEFMQNAVQNMLQAAFEAGEEEDWDDDEDWDDED